MPEINLNNISIHFPYQPYSCQIEYMSKVITCIENKYNGLLESPTGTGKTLSLLCATLGWLDNYKKNISSNKTISQIFENPKIIYASRTHTQLDQVVKELKKTLYTNKVKTTILASRDQLCIHPQVSKESNNNQKIQKCRGKIYHRTCFFYNNMNDYFGSLTTLNEKKMQSNVIKNFELPTVPDIEELVSFGQSNKMCPYYTARELTKTADLILMPYNYLVDLKNQLFTSNSKSRKKVIEATSGSGSSILQGAIIIFDEAHNLEKFCEDAASIELNSIEIAQSLCQIDEIIFQLKQSSSLINSATNIQQLVYCSNELKRSRNNEKSFKDTPDFTKEDDIFQNLTIEELARLKEIMFELENVIDQYDITSTPGSGSMNNNSYNNSFAQDKGTVLSIDYIVEEWLINRFRINSMVEGQALLQLLERVITCCTQLRDANSASLGGTELESDSGNFSIQTKKHHLQKISPTTNTNGLEKFATLLKTLFGLHESRDEDNLQTADGIQYSNRADTFSSSPLHSESKDSNSKNKESLRDSMFKKFDIRCSNISSTLRPGRNAKLKELVQANMKNFKLHLRGDSNLKELPHKLKSQGWSLPASIDQRDGSHLISRGRILSLWCFSPSQIIQDLFRKGIRCMILTSGTLSPINTFSQIMNLKFEVTLENDHIIKSDQIHLSALSKGPDNCTLLNSSFKNRNCGKYMTALGLTLLNISRIITTGGILVFFPSYLQLSNCVEFWKNESQIWINIERIKPIFTEPKSKDLLVKEMTAYYKALDSNEIDKQCSAIFLAVCRGKVSEGYDFADKYARLVLIFGIPYPARHDPKVSLKIQFMNERYEASLKSVIKYDNSTATSSLLNGDSWYRLEADRAINQAVGRVIRHKLDYGAILLCDERFHSVNQNNSRLSKWLRPQLKISPNFGSVIGQLKRFFLGAKKYDNNFYECFYEQTSQNSTNSRSDNLTGAKRKKRLKSNDKSTAFQTNEWLDIYKKSSSSTEIFDEAPLFDNTQHDVYYDASSLSPLSNSPKLFESQYSSTMEKLMAKNQKSTPTPNENHKTDIVRSSITETRNYHHQVLSNQTVCDSFLNGQKSVNALSLNITAKYGIGNVSAPQSPISPRSCLMGNSDTTISTIKNEASCLSTISSPVTMNKLDANNKAKTASIAIIKTYKSLEHFLSNLKKEFRKDLDQYYAFCEDLKQYNRTKNLQRFIERIDAIFVQDVRYYCFVNHLKKYVRKEDVGNYVKLCLNRYSPITEIMPPLKTVNQEDVITPSRQRLTTSLDIYITPDTRKLTQDALMISRAAKNSAAKFRISTINSDTRVNSHTINDHTIAPDLIAKAKFKEKINAKYENKNKHSLKQQQSSILNHFKYASNNT